MSAPAAPHGTVTFVFTDIEGSTELLKRLGADGYGGAVANHRRIIREQFESRGGTEMDAQGDAFFFSFARARDAVAAAVAAQLALEAFEWPRGARVRVRMSLHTGEPVVGEEGYVGIDVVRAARICAAGHGGQVLLSAATSYLVANDLPEGVRERDLGRHKLKDLDRAEQIYQLEVPGLPSTFPPLKTRGEERGSFEERIERRALEFAERTVERSLARPDGTPMTVITLGRGGLMVSVVGLLVLALLITFIVLIVKLVV